MINKVEIRKMIEEFLREMQEWEIRCLRREHACDTGSGEYEDAERDGMQEYLELFKKYCSPDACPRDYYYSDPPEYDHEQQVIESIEETGECSAIVSISTTTSSEERFQYLLEYEGTNWKIRKKSYVSKVDGRLIDANL